MDKINDPRTVFTVTVTDMQHMDGQTIADIIGVPLERYYSQGVLDEAVKRARVDALASLFDQLTKELEYNKKYYNRRYAQGFEQALKIVKEAMDELQG